ncbi:MAG: hypothetical protein K6E29_07095 [Cyanobacteria bacterium RUI128]|nr:hypothetical protein [Cyanobacteria bacterium RUI128]
MVSNVSAQQQVAANQNNPYANMGTSMANDFFGAQLFGTNPAGYNQPINPNPTNAASAILAQYQATAGGGNYMDDYALAMTVANQMSQGANNVLMSPYTSFTENDIFAGQLFGPNPYGCYC